jgi:hypothetical protein
MADECPETRVVTGLDFFPLWPGEPPPMGHAPGECPGTSMLRRYRCPDGVIRWLCSWCGPGMAEAIGGPGNG